VADYGTLYARGWGRKGKDSRVFGTLSAFGLRAGTFGLRGAVPRGTRKGKALTDAEQVIFGTKSTPSTRLRTPSSYFDLL